MLKINRDVIIAFAVVCLSVIIVAIKSVWWALPTMVALPLVVLAHNVNYDAVMRALKRWYSHEESLAYAVLPAVIIDRMARLPGGMGGVLAFVLAAYIAAAIFNSATLVLIAGLVLSSVAPLIVYWNTIKYEWRNDVALVVKFYHGVYTKLHREDPRSRTLSEDTQERISGQLFRPVSEMAGNLAFIQARYMSPEAIHGSLMLWCPHRNTNEYIQTFVDRNELRPDATMVNLLCAVYGYDRTTAKMSTASASFYIAPSYVEGFGSWTVKIDDDSDARLM